MAQTLYAALAELKARVREELLILAYDHLDQGQPDGSALMTDIIIPANGDIDASLCGPGGIFPTGLGMPPYPAKIVEIAVDGMHFRLGSRFPTIVVVDHRWLEKKVAKDLDDIRRSKGKSLGMSIVEPSSIQGGYITPDIAGPPKTPMFSGKKGKWGIF